MRNRVDLKDHIATGRIHDHLITFHFTDHGARNMRVHLDQIRFSVCFVLAHDAVGHASVIAHIDQSHRRTKNHLA